MSQQQVHVPDGSLPSTGSSRTLVPPPQRYYQATATSCRPSRRASFPSFGDTTGARAVSLPPSPRATMASLGLVTRYPRPGILPWRRQDLPSSWGTPIPVCPCSPTPAGRCVPDHQGRSRGPREGNDEGADDKDFRGSIAWLPDSLPTYHDVGCPSPRKAHFQVPVKLSWTGLIPAGSQQKVSNSLHARLPPFPSFLAQAPFPHKLQTSER
jgi:hypothetical protein